MKKIINFLLWLDGVLKGNPMKKWRLNPGIFLAGVVLMWACSTNRPLIKRGLTAEERRHFIIQNGFGIAEDIKQSFLSGFPMVGMSKDLIFQLYGRPDRSFERDRIWEYLDNRGQLVSGFKFDEGKVKEIVGDPRGGLPENEEPD